MSGGSARSAAIRLTQPGWLMVNTFDPTPTNGCQALIYQGDMKSRWRPADLSRGVGSGHWDHPRPHDRGVRDV